MAHKMFHSLGAWNDGTLNAMDQRGRFGHTNIEFCCTPGKKKKKAFEAEGGLVGILVAED